MSNPIAPTTQPTKNGSSDKKSNKPANPQNPTTISDVAFSLKEETMSFMADLAIAQRDQGDVEADPLVIAHILGHPLKEGEGYFWYQGVKVFEKGKREQILKEEDKSVEQRKFGS